MVASDRTDDGLIHSCVLVKPQFTAMGHSFQNQLNTVGKCLSIGLGSWFSEVRTTQPFLLILKPARIYVAEDTGCSFGSTTQKVLFLAQMRWTFSVMARGVHQV